MTKSRLAHRVLDDCAVSDAEFNAVADDFVACMARKRFVVHIIDQGGSFSVDSRPDTRTDGGEADPAMTHAMRACSSGFDAVAGIVGRMQRNPDHLDEDEIFVACLIKAGVADKGYTVADYRRELEAEHFSYNRDSFKAVECGRDPLGLVPAHN